MTSEPPTPQDKASQNNEAPHESAEAPNAQSPAAATPSFGWNAYAERINGRFAMIGFVALVLLELITHQTFFAWIGL